MPLRVEEMVQSRGLNERFIFLSASIPDPQRWTGPYDAFEITDAVVAAVQSVFTASGRLLCAVHPTIAPLLLNVASGFPLENREKPLVLIYQSRFFEEAIVAETKQIALRPGLGVIRWTHVPEPQDPEQKRRESLAVMRQEMLRQGDPAAAIFIGGMEGIGEEFELFRSLFPRRPAYALARPGGAAALLVQEIDSPLVQQLRESDIYPVLLQAVVDDLTGQLENDRSPIA
jgi:hypothetical protein